MPSISSQFNFVPNVPERDIEDAPRVPQSRASKSKFTATVVHRRRSQPKVLSNEFQSLSLRRRDLVFESLQSSQLFTKNLVALDLSRNRLNDLPTSLRHLSENLQHLNVSENQFQHFPDVILALRNLRTLDVSINKISGPLHQRLSSSTPSLREFTCYGNYISSLPTVTSWRSLTRLRCGSPMLGGNSIQYISEGMLPQMPSLEELDMTMNKLTGLPEDIGHRGSRLKNLSLGSNRLERLPESIGLCDHLQYVNLESNLLCSLPPELGYLKKLRVLNLSNNILCQVPAEVVSGLTSNGEMQVFLTGNPFSRPSIRGPARPVMQLRGFATALDSHKSSSRGLKSLSSFGRESRHKSSKKVSKHGKPTVGFGTRISRSLIKESLRMGLLPEQVSDIDQVVTQDMIQRGKILNNVVGGMSQIRRQRTKSIPEGGTEGSILLLPSLVELAARSLVAKSAHLIPTLGPMALHYIRSGTPCVQSTDKIDGKCRSGSRLYWACQGCGGPFLHQYISTTEVIGVMGHVNVPVARNYCSSGCLGHRLQAIQEECSDRVLEICVIRRNIAQQVS